MRLLHIHRWQFQEFYSDPPPYVITSHRWTADELTFQDMTGPSLPPHVVNKAGYQKLLNFCKAIQKLREMCPKLEVEWIWIDTCCIDKTNSVELQEALNSMFRWYSKAEVCLTYLHDVVSLDEHPEDVRQSFRQSVWHTRGWCLQELLASKRILFYNQDWEVLGTKKTRTATPWSTARVAGLVSLNLLIHDATAIPREVIYDFDRVIHEIEIEERKSWMNGRSTARIEDRVYCQLGIFGVFMPLIYGEGEHAMFRLDEAIAQKRLRDKKPASRATPF